MERIDPYDSKTILLLLSEPLPEEEYDDEEEDSSEEDVEEIVEEFSDLEQEVSSSDDFEEESRENCYLGRDKVTKWRSVQPTQNVRTRSCNVVTHLRGVKGRAKEAKSAIDCWKCFISDDILEIITENTNKYIDKIKLSYALENKTAIIL
jgi:hypothetical protein